MDRQQRQPDLKSVSRKSCSLLSRVLQCIPLALVAAVAAWSYYVFVIKLSLFELASFSAQQLIYLVSYHALLFLFSASLLRTVLAGAGDVPAKYRLTGEMKQALKAAKSEEEWMSLLELFVLQMDLSVFERSVQGAIRYCDKCCAIKPDRSHHCSVCGVCVLKMDHHCMWVNNCVGYSNYKFFLLFLFYAYLYCAFLLACSSVRLIAYWTAVPGEEESVISLHYAFLCLLSGVFFLFLSSLFWYHVYLVCRNRSTLEEFRAPVTVGGQEISRLYDLSAVANARQVFGQQLSLWLLPVYSTEGDGLTFPRSSRVRLEEEEEEARSLSEMPPSPVAVETKVVFRDERRRQQQHCVGGGMSTDV